jgi:16S rRNA (cytosine967-C5)-methyltransferase
VKPGGRLVYATCSLLPEENEAIVAAFLAANEGFVLLSAEDAGQAGHHHRLRRAAPSDPAAHDTDGFFAAVLERKA